MFNIYIVHSEPHRSCNGWRSPIVKIVGSLLQQSGQTKDSKHAAFKSMSKDSLVGIRIMLPKVAICLPVDCCISDLAL